MQKKIYNTCKCILQVYYSNKFIVNFCMYNLIFITLKYWDFITINPLNKNIYDLFMFIFNDYFFIAYLLTIPILTLFYRFGLTNKIDENLILKFKNRVEWFLTNVLLLLYVSFIYVFGVILLLLVLSIVRFDWKNIWSPFAIDKYELLVPILDSLSPLNIVFFNFSLVYLYILAMGFMIFITHILFQKPLISFFLPLMFNVFGVITFLGKIDYLLPFSFTSHTLINLVNYEKEGVLVSFLSSLFYWVVIIAVLFIVGIVSVRKKDLNWSEK